jgi:potassium-dependent mechanosensitive channel
LSTDKITPMVEGRLPQLTKEIELRTTEMAKLLAASVPLEFLHYMEVAVQTFSNELSTWNHDLTERVKTLDDQIAQLDRLSKIWKSTLQLPELSQTAPENLKHVQNLIDSVGRTQRTVESLRKRDLNLQGRVLEATARLQLAFSALEQAQADAVKNLFVQDSPRIWNLWGENWGEESRASLKWRASVSVFLAYIRHRPTVFLLHAIFILLLIPVVHWLRRRIHKWTEEELSLRRAAPVFDLPVSTAIVLSFLITGPLYSAAPFLLRAILGGALLIPTALFSAG